MRAILSVLTVATILSVATEVTAHHSSTPHPFKSASITWDPDGPTRGAPVRIDVSHNGSEYTQIFGNVETRFRLQAKAKAFHRILNFQVTLFGDGGPGDEVGISGAVSPLQKSIDRHRTFVMAAHAALKGAFGITADSPEQIFAKKCNDKYGDNLPTEDEYLETVQIQVHARFVAIHWRKDSGSGAALAHTTFPASIYCRGRPAKSVLAPKPESVDIRAKQVGEHCPARTEVTAYVDYLEKANPRIRAVLQGHVGRAVPFVAVETKEVSFFGKTWHRVEHAFEYDLDPGKYNFRIEVEGGPNSAWAPIEIKCPPFEIVFTSLEYEAEEAEVCPKLVEETIVFTTNGPGEIEYEVKVSGSQWFGRKGTVQAVRDGDRYLAVADRVFPQEKEIDVFMTVEATKISGPNKPGGLANASARLKVDCPLKTAVPSGSDKLAEPPRPQPPAPPPPVIVVDPVPQLVCTNGRVVGTGARATCVCPRGQERRDLGRNRFRCERPVVQVTCQGGTVRGNDCVCARTLQKVQTGPSAWRCERPAAKVGSGPSTVRPATTIQPAIKSPTQTRPVICQGGTVRRGECVCPRGQQKAPMAAANAWRCFDPRPARGPSVRPLPAQRSR